jgi:hypothetical protein
MEPTAASVVKKSGLSKPVKIAIAFGLIALLATGIVYAATPKKKGTKKGSGGSGSENERESGSGDGSDETELTNEQKGQQLINNSNDCQAQPPKKTGVTKVVNGITIYEAIPYVYYGGTRGCEADPKKPRTWLNDLGQNVNPLTGLPVKAGEGKGSGMSSTLTNTSAGSGKG